jgi:AraC-like DNA-binding protein
MAKNRSFLSNGIIMTSNRDLSWDREIDVVFRVMVRQQLPCAATRGWIMQPFPVLIWNIRGCGETTYRDPCLGRVPRPENSVAYIMANEVRQSATYSPDGLDYLMVSYSFEYRGGFNLLNFYELPNVLPENVQQALREAMERLEQSENATICDATMQAVQRKLCGYALLDALLRCAKRRQDGAPQWRRLQPVVEYLNDHFAEPIAVETLIAMTPYSRAHFFRLFQTQLHSTPVAYIQRLRVRAAAIRLLHSADSVAAVGAAVGWQDAFYFSKIFKQLTGMSPLAYRKNRGDELGMGEGKVGDEGRDMDIEVSSGGM